jgi:hypothetical protein
MSGIAFMSDRGNQSIASLSPVFLERSQKRMVCSHVADQKACSYERGLEMRIVSNCRETFVYGAKAVTDGQSRVPKEAQNSIHEMACRTCAVTCMKKENVEIGKRGKLGSPVTADGDYSAFVFIGCARTASFTEPFCFAICALDNQVEDKTPR